MDRVAIRVVVVGDEQCRIEEQRRVLDPEEPVGAGDRRVLHGRKRDGRPGSREPARAVRDGVTERGVAPVVGLGDEHDRAVWRQPHGAVAGLAHRGELERLSVGRDVGIHFIGEERRGGDDERCVLGTRNEFVDADRGVVDAGDRDKRLRLREPAAAVGNGVAERG